MKARDKRKRRRARLARVATRQRLAREADALVQKVSMGEVLKLRFPVGPVLAPELPPALQRFVNDSIEMNADALRRAELDLLIFGSTEVAIEDGRLRTLPHPAIGPRLLAPVRLATRDELRLLYPHGPAERVDPCSFCGQPARWRSTWSGQLCCDEHHAPETDLPWSAEAAR